MGGKYQAYPAYKDSGVEWLGAIPHHWYLSKVKFTTKCLDGSRIPLNAEERGSMKGDIPYWGANKVVDYIDSYIFDEDLVLLGEDGAPFFDPSKEVAFNVGGKIWPNNHVHVLRPLKNVVEPRFLRHALNCADYHLYISGSTRDKLNQSDMNEIYIRCCDLPEQEKIANFLDHETAKIDTLIEKQQQLIKLLKEKRQAVISHAVTKGLNPDAPMRDSGVEWLGKVPAHWDVMFIKHLSTVKRGASPRPIDDQKYFDDDGEYAWVRIADVSKAGMYLISTTQRLSNLGASLSVKLEVDQLFVSIAGTVGKPCLTTSKACIHDGFVYFPELSVNNKFLYYIFEAGEAYLGLGKMGTQLNLNTDTVGGIKVGVPPTNEIDQIVEYIECSNVKYDNLIKKANRSIFLMQERRTAIISAAVTGKIDVRDWVAPVPPCTRDISASCTSQAPDQENKEDAA